MAWVWPGNRGDPRYALSARRLAGNVTHPSNRCSGSTSTWWANDLVPLAVGAQLQPVDLVAAKLNWTLYVMELVVDAWHFRSRKGPLKGRAKLPRRIALIVEAAGSLSSGKRTTQAMPGWTCQPILLVKTNTIDCPSLLTSTLRTSDG